MDRAPTATTMDRPPVTHTAERFKREMCAASTPRIVTEGWVGGENKTGEASAH